MSIFICVWLFLHHPTAIKTTKDRDVCHHLQCTENFIIHAAYFSLVHTPYYKFPCNNHLELILREFVTFKITLVEFLALK